MQFFKIVRNRVQNTCKILLLMIYYICGGTYEIQQIMETFN